MEGYGSMILDAKKEAAKEETKQDGTRLKILTPKQILQRLPIVLAQVKAGNNSDIKWNQTNCLFFISIKRNYQRSIQ